VHLPVLFLLRYWRWHPTCRLGATARALWPPARNPNKQQNCRTSLADDRDVFRRLIKLVEAPLLSSDALDRTIAVAVLVVVLVAGLLVGAALAINLLD